MSKNIEKTIEIVRSYMEMKHEKILSWEHLKMNLETGIGRGVICYETAEKEYFRLKGK